MPAQFGDEDVNRLRIALARTVKELDRRSAEQGLTRTELTVLGAIFRCSGVRLAELAELEGVNPTMLSRILAKLEAGGLARRVADPDDRRAARAEITAAGKKLWERHRKVRTKVLTDLLGRLSQQDAAALLAAVPALEALGELARPTVVNRTDAP